MDDAMEEPLHVTVERGLVIVSGPGIAATLTAAAALVTSDRMHEAAAQALGKQRGDDVEAIASRS